MIRFVSICLILLLAVLLVAPTHDAAAQSVKVKRYATSPGKDPTLPIYTGLRGVGQHTKVFLVADTTGSGSNVVTSIAWTILAPLPAGSTAVIDSASTWRTSFTADTVGTFYVQVTANGSVSARDTIYAANYVGVGGLWGSSSQFPQCGSGGCHGPGWFSGDKLTPWSSTGHANMLKKGLTGKLETTNGVGMYAPLCEQCHTTGYNQTANNGNFGYLAKQSGWDTSWVKPYTFVPPFLYEIPFGDTTAWSMLTTNPAYAAQVPVAAIGCESCHGPGSSHGGNTKKISKTFNASLCNTCHDAPPHHTQGTEWNLSDHAAMAKGHVASTDCYPCHSGTAFPKWLDNKASPAWSVEQDDMAPIACATCHDPHDPTNPNQLRTVSFDSLMNGFVPAAGDGGKGQICMNCHHSRYNVADRVTNTPPYYGFVNHYGPHGNPQADMFFGQNAFQYGDTNLTGLRTHGGVKDGCVTCHMESNTADLTSRNGHTWQMADTLGNDRVAACEKCHGPLTSFEDIKAAYDYDGNGVVEGVQTEISGLLTKLKNKLRPYWNATTGEPTDNIADSLLVKGHQRAIQDIYTYYFVKNEGSMGVHNAKYALSLLQKALDLYPLNVQKSDLNIPKEFVLNQNYPNPFNPTTTITFSLPKSEEVKLEVYDVVGHLVKTLANNTMSAGNFTVTWDGQDANGAKVASGVYLYRLHAGSFNAVKKMLLLK